MTASNPPAAGSPGVDPSMEDILASIRRILSEDEADAQAKPEPASPGPAAQPVPHAPPGPPEVLALDASMLVNEPPPLPEALPGLAGPRATATAASAAAAAKLMTPAAPLLDDAVASAAANSVGSLLRTLSERQPVQIYRGGPTLEDMVREEIRPLLKQWLDSNLPPLVERLVRTEIERVVGRALS